MSAFDAIVVGSGFGGAIAAARLAATGRRVVVLERGRRYRPGDFPRNVKRVEDLFWDQPGHGKHRGLYDVRAFDGIGAVVAAGVGGGSLVYANIHIRPDASVFDDPRWPAPFTRAFLDPYYERVAARLEVAPLPESIQLAKRDRYREAAAALHRPIFDPDQAVRWSGAKDGDRGPCELVAECEFGCRHGAKNTLDMTYLADAERHGAEVRPNVWATHVAPNPGGGYQVHVVDTVSGGRESFSGTHVVLAAGTLGTNEILFRSRDNMKTLPNVSRQLGRGYSGNGDFLGSIQNSRFDLEPWRGPDVTSVMKFFDTRPGFTMAAPTFNQPVMRVLASLGQPEGPAMRLLAPAWRMLPDAISTAFRTGLLSQPLVIRGPHAGDASRMTNLFAIGQDNANGVVRFDNDRLDIEWKYAEENQALIARMEQAMRDVAGVYGGTFAPLASWSAFRRILTVHSLGGCHLATDPSHGVVSTEGEVFGHPGLFVADGSVVPTAIGFHPCMTIAAIAERIAEGVAAR
ncbi:MAG TPA: GMC oxidoreductase [Vicinamibacterales bacterium]|nr:GMC oxidoreductase [Vicinamibacterales bacterium]